MVKSKINLEWILLIHQLPPKPTNLRVKIWRKLQRLGAIPVKNSVYVLPFNEKTHEDFEWLKQEIETAGGEATVFRAASVQGATDEEIIGSFRRARDEEYSKLTAEFDALSGAIKEQKRNHHLSIERVARYESELGKLRAEMERINVTDFFTASKGKEAVAAFGRCQKALRSFSQQKSSPADSEKDAKESFPLADYQEKRWVTRRNLHIDRLASAWLIRRFIDRKPRFYFVAEDETVENSIRFDMFGAEFTHVGDDCTFETLLKRFALTENAALGEIAEIVHDIDLKDDKFNRLEAKGLDSIVRGLAKLLQDDRKLLNQCNIIFDGLYELLSRQPAKFQEEQQIEPAREKENNKDV